MQHAVIRLAAIATVGTFTLAALAQDEPVVRPATTQASTNASAGPGEIPPLPPRLPERIVPAFPGAWGGGMFTTGGRGGRVIEVTNLNDSGEGSFRAAAEAQGARIIVFRVAGLIPMLTNVNINHGDVTIAGQTAPGDGVCFSEQSLNINAENVIIRHLRVRRGIPRGGQGSDNIGGNPIGRIVIDHCSTSWGMDENLSLYRHMKPMGVDEAGKPRPDVKMATQRLTIQNSISSEALNAGGHAFGGTWGGTNSTFHHNLFASNTARNPSIGMSGDFDFRNNVVFNWGHRTMDGGDETSRVNVINNYYKAGPASNANMRSTIIRIEQRNMYSPGNRWKSQAWYPAAKGRPGKWFVSGNVIDGDEERTADNWKAVQGPMELARVNTPHEAWPVMQQSARDAFETVLSKAGATLPKRDAVDARVTNSVRTGEVIGTGIVKDPKDVGGYPNYTFDSKSVPADADHDGMPDEWEERFKLNSNDAADGTADTDGDGYTNVEECLNGTDPTVKIDYLNLDNNVDTIS